MMNIFKTFTRWEEYEVYPWSALTLVSCDPDDYERKSLYEFERFTYLGKLDGPWHLVIEVKTCRVWKTHHNCLYDQPGDAFSLKKLFIKLKEFFCETHR